MAVECDAVLRATAGREWRLLLPTEDDSEQQRQAKEKQLLRLLHVKTTLVDAGRSAATAGTAATQDSTPAGRPPLAPRPTTQPGGSGWRQTARSTAAAKRRRWQRQPQPALESAAVEQPQAACSAEAVPAGAAAVAPLALPQPAAPAPAPAAVSLAAPKPVLEENCAAAGVDYTTPVSRRMLPGPGQAMQHWSASARERISSGGGGGGDRMVLAPLAGSGTGIVPPSTASSGGIPSLPSSVSVRASALPTSAVASGRGGLRRVLGAASAGPALSGGQLPLSAGGGHLADRAAAAQLPSSCCIPPPPLLAEGSDQQQQGPRQRKWKLPQQHSNPLTRLLQRNVPPPQQQQQPQQLDDDCEDGGSGGGEALRHNRSTRFAAEQPAAVAAGVLRPSLSLPPPAGAAFPQQQHRGWGPIAGTQQHAAWAEQRAAAALEAEQLALQNAAGSDALAALLLGQTSSPQHCKQGREAAAAAAGAAKGDGLKAGSASSGQQQDAAQQQQPMQQQQQQQQLQPGSLLCQPGAGGPGTNWSLPPTPSCMYSLSPDHPAPSAAPASVGNGQQGEPPSGAAGGGKTPGTLAGGAAAAGGPGCCMLPDLSCAADTPALVPSQSNVAPQGMHERSAVAVEGPRRLFVAETPADAVARMTMPFLRFEARPPEAAAAASADAAAAPAARQRSSASAFLPAVAPAAVPAAGPACAVQQAAGLQLHLPQPVLQVSPCADGRHLALLLGSYAPAGEPTDILVLQLPASPEAATPAPVAPGAAANNRLGLHVVASVAVQRSRWSEGLELTANCLQLASRERAGLLLILSAALELSDQPAATQASILILSLPISGSSSHVASGDIPAAAGAGSRTQPPPLAVECSVPLTCVLLEGSGSLLASGDGGCVRRLDFDPLWRTYNWARPLPAATYRAVPFEDVQQLQLYRCAEDGRQLLLGLSSSGGVALWDVARSELLMARAHVTYRLRSLQPISLSQAGLSSAPAQPVGPEGVAARGSATASAAAGGCAGGVLRLFVGLVQHRRSGEQRVAAVMLSSRGVSVSSSSAVTPLPCQQAAQQRERQQQQQQQQSTAVAFAGRCCWLGTAGGDLLQWPTGGSAHNLKSRGQLSHVGSGAVSSLCTMPEGSGGKGWWQLVAATADGSCSLLAAH